MCKSVQSSAPDFPPSFSLAETQLTLSPKLTDVSYVICSGQVNGKEIEQFVAPGTHCEQGIPGQKIDVVNVSGPATATRVFVQHSKDGAAVSSYVPPSLRPEYTKTTPFDFRETAAA